MRETPGVGVIAAAIAPQIQYNGARRMSSEISSRGCEETANALPARVINRLDPDHPNTTITRGKHPKGFVPLSPRLRNLAGPGSLSRPIVLYPSAGSGESQRSSAGIHSPESSRF